MGHGAWGMEHWLLILLPTPLLATDAINRVSTHSPLLKIRPTVLG
ncbi:MAG: hypothetical protein V7L05_21855 [Nostoc sp.]